MSYREQIPIDKGLDHTLTAMMEGYLYISNRRKKFNRDMFETRLLGGQKAVCIAGMEAAKIFYDEKYFIRTGAAPKRIRKTIFGEKAVQTLDGEKHKRRKALLLSILDKSHLQGMINIFKEEWEVSINKWKNMNEVVLYEEVKEILAKAACNWVGVPLQPSDVKQLTEKLAALYDSAATVGPRHWQGRVARNELEKWLGNMAEQMRLNNESVDEKSPFYKIIWFRDEYGNLLQPQIAAAETLNLLRPIVAVSIYITFIALALKEFPEEKVKAENGDDAYIEMFVQEVRRYYPFFPFAAARVREDFLWNGHNFKKGSLVLLDIYGTNHHPDIWKNPNEFRPERFKDREENPFDLIPQGAGDFQNGHRCPGEWLTIALMKEIVKLLTRSVDYVVPKQNLQYSMVRIPSLPKSRFIISNIKRK